MNRIVVVLTLILSTMIFSAALAKSNNESNFHAGQMAEGAPAELMHWGKLIGQWTVL